MSKETKPKRSVFEKLMTAFDSLDAEREGKVTLKRTRVPRPVPLHVSAEQIRAIRENLHFSRALFARCLRINERSLEGWEHGKRQTPEWAAVLILLVGQFPEETLDHLQKIDPSLLPAMRESVEKGERKESSGK